MVYEGVSVEGPGIEDAAFWGEICDMLKSIELNNAGISNFCTLN